MTSARMVVCASHTPGMLRDKAGEFGHAFRAGVAEAAARVAAFAPELVVFFGSDHRRAFVDPVPAIAVMTGAEGMGDLGSATGRYDVPAKIAAELAGRLLDRDFDITVGRDIALDHGFGQTYEQLIGSLPDGAGDPGLHQLRHAAARAAGPRVRAGPRGRRGAVLPGPAGAVRRLRRALALAAVAWSRRPPGCRTPSGWP